MRKIIAGLIVIGFLSAPVLAWDNALYLQQTKWINGSYTYYIPKLEILKQRSAGDLFGTKCNYISEFEGALVYTAPREHMFQINHHSVQWEYHMGVEVGNWFATYSLGLRTYIEGNSDGLIGTEGLNSARLGIKF